MAVTQTFAVRSIGDGSTIGSPAAVSVASLTNTSFVLTYYAQSAQAIASVVSNGTVLVGPNVTTSITSVEGQPVTASLEQGGSWVTAYSSGDTLYVIRDSDQSAPVISRSIPTGVAANVDIDGRAGTFDFAVVYEDRDFNPLKAGFSVGLQTTANFNSSVFETRLSTAGSDLDPSVVVLGNGDVAVAWDSLSGGNYQLWTAVYRPNGTAVRLPAATGIVGSNAHNVSLTRTSGGFAAVFSDDSWGASGTDITLATYDNVGNQQRRFNISNPTLATSSQNESYAEVTPLVNGLFAVSWDDDSTANTDAKVAVIDTKGTGSVLAVQTVNFGQPQADDVQRTSLDSFGRAQSGFVVAAQDATSNLAVYSVYEVVRQFDGDSADNVIGGVDPLNHYIYGLGGNDTLSGHVGDDLLNGGADTDLLMGNDGNDRLYAEDSNDQLYGEVGDDTLVGGYGDDTLFGQDGQDTLFGEGGHDLLIGGAGDDTIYGQAENDVLFGEQGDDVLLGGEGEDRLYGQVGSDTLQGGEGNDLLNGDAGTDLLIGGAGADSLTGGANTDFFRFTSLTDPADSITDFNSSQGDRIQLEAAIFGAPAGFQFTAGVGFLSGADVQPVAQTATLYFDTTTRALWYDADGTGAGGGSVLAFLLNTPVLHASDFVLI